MQGRTDCTMKNKTVNFRLLSKDLGNHSQKTDKETVLSL